MDKNDYKRLDIERAQMTVSIQSAKDLVTDWMGPGFTDAETPDGAPMPTLLSSTAGLGFKQPEAQAGPENKALGKLKRLHKGKFEHKGKPESRGDARGDWSGSKGDVRGDSKGSSNGDKSGSNGALKGDKTAFRDGKPSKHGIKSADDSDEEESRASIKKQKRSAMTAMDAYRQSKKKKR